MLLTQEHFTTDFILFTLHTLLSLRHRNNTQTYGNNTIYPIHAQTHTRALTCTQTRARTHAHIHARARTHTYTHTYIYTHTPY